MKLVVIGCGRMGSGLARTLCARGHTVTVVDRDATALGALGLAFHGEVLQGDALDRELLVRAGVERIDGLATVTGSDEVNIVVARLASGVFGVPRVVARLYDPRKAEIYQRLGVQTVATTSWGAHRMAELLSYSWLDTIQSIGSGDVDIVETEVPPLLVDRTVRELDVPGEIQVVALSRGGRTFLPTLGTVFQPGDLVHLAVLTTSVERLKALLGLR